MTGVRTIPIERRETDRQREIEVGREGTYQSQMVRTGTVRVTAISIFHDDGQPNFFSILVTTFQTNLSSYLNESLKTG